jgi:hypothetical protein
MDGDGYVVDETAVKNASKTVADAAKQINYGGGRFAELASLRHAVTHESWTPPGGGGSGGPYGDGPGHVDEIYQKVGALIAGPYQQAVNSAARFIAGSTKKLTEVSKEMADSATDYGANDREGAGNFGRPG